MITADFMRLTFSSSFLTTNFVGCNAWEVKRPQWDFSIFAGQHGRHGRVGRPRQRGSDGLQRRQLHLGDGAQQQRQEQPQQEHRLKDRLAEGANPLEHTSSI